MIAWLRRQLSSGVIGPLPYEPKPSSIRRTSEAQRNRGIRAAALLADPLIVEALAAVDRRAHDAWAGSGAGENSLREQAYWRLMAAAAFRAELEALIRDGLVAENDIETNTRLNESRRQQENS